MKVLITGAGGFCGRHLFRYSIGQGAETYTIGTKRSSPNHYFADLSDISATVTAIKAIAPDCVFHLAGVADSPRFSDFYLVNVTFAVNLLRSLEICGKLDCPVLLCGTAAEYGVIAPQDLPITEDTPARPYGHYGISKLTQTLMGVTLSKTGYSLIMVRPFNIIGPGMPSFLSIGSFAKQIIGICRQKLRPIIAVGNLDNRRDFIDVNDVVKIYWDLLHNPRARGEVINICRGEAVMLGDILRRLIDLSGECVDVQNDPTRIKAIDIPVHYGSNKKLSDILGYLPDTPLDKSLRRLLGSM